MRFFALIALLGTAASLKLTQNHAGHSKTHLAKVDKLHKHLAKYRTKQLIKAKFLDLPQEQMDEIHAWIEEEMNSGDEAICADEMQTYLTNFAAKHNYPPPTPEMWEEAGEFFASIDTDGDNCITSEEGLAALEAE